MRIDLGIKTLVTLSNRKAKATLKLNETEVKIKKHQKRILHKISKDIVKKYNVIKMENLDLK